MPDLGANTVGRCLPAGDNLWPGTFADDRCTEPLVAQRSDDPACGTERPTLATLSTPGGLVVRQVGDPWSGPVTVSSAASCIRRDASLDGDRFYRLGDPVDPGTFAEVVLRVE